MPKRIGLIAAVPVEAEGVVRAMTRVSQRDGVTYGAIGGVPVALTLSGIGIANAARAATMLIARGSPRLIINFGIAGAYPSSGLRITQVAVATSETYADMGLMLTDGLHPMEAVGLPLAVRGRKRYFNTFPLDRKLALMASRHANITGAFLTVHQATGTNKRARELMARNPGAICENMEGAAVAHVCLTYGVPALEIRGISNIAEKRVISNWRIKEAALKASDSLIDIIISLR